MRDRDYGLHVRVRIRYEAEIAADIVCDILNALQSAAYRTEEEFLEELARVFQLSGREKSAARNRLRTLEGAAFSVRRVSPGSIELEGELLRLAVQVLAVVIGATLADAWRRTDLNERVRDVLTSNLPELTRRIASRIRRSIGRRSAKYRPPRRRRVDIRHRVSTVRYEMINVEIEVSEEQGAQELE